MATQLKKGFVEIFVLAALLREDSYGYKIIQDVSRIIQISESTLYPVLRRLENQKFVLEYTKEHNGRLRKYYTITSLGKAKVNSFIDEWQEVKQVYDFIIENK